MRQRGIQRGDIRLILECGTQIDKETWFVRRRDVMREIELRKREIQALGRLAGRKLVVRDGLVITAYFSGRDDQRRTLHRDGRRKKRFALSRR